MKNLLNCHSIGLHSFPLSLDEDGLYRRVFYADYNHQLWRPFEIAIHPHHVDIKITVLHGRLTNQIFKINDTGMKFRKFQWDSLIRGGKGGFTCLGEEHLIQESNFRYGPGNHVKMRACELHTVFVEKGEICCWLIEETKPSCDYFPINYSVDDLESWTPEGLYIETTQSMAHEYIGHLIKNIK